MSQLTLAGSQFVDFYPTETRNSSPSSWQMGNVHPQLARRLLQSRSKFLPSPPTGPSSKSDSSKKKETRAVSKNSDAQWPWETKGNLFHWSSLRGNPSQKKRKRAPLGNWGKGLGGSAQAIFSLRAVVHPPSPHAFA